MKLKHYLIASEHNEFKPWIVTPTALAVFCLAIWGLRAIVPASLTLAASGISSADLMAKVNEQRTQRFIPALNTNSKLIAAATGKANDMIARSYFAHVDPDGKYVWPRIESSGYTPYLTLGENLAMDFTDADGVVNAWMNSPTHRTNIVNTKFEDQGLASIAGAYEPDHDTVMVVSLFGTLIKKASASPVPTQSLTPKATPAPPTPTPVIKNPPSTASSVKISNDIKVITTTLSGKTLVEVNVIIAGSPTLVTANLKGQSITLIAGKVAGEFVGSFTFDSTEDLTKQTLSVEARDKNNVKATLDYPVNIEGTEKLPDGDKQTIPVSNEAQVMKILRIIFGIFATIYMGFLAVDAIIMHRNKIKREGIHPNPHLLIFALVALVTLFANW